MGGTLVKNKVTVKCFFFKKTAYLLVFLFFFGDIYEIIVKNKENLKDKIDSKI
tara:strand:+ start:68 stop:226 length:159 start_codon:yes stop_codon:yes gene_type:complete